MGTGLYTQLAIFLFFAVVLRGFSREMFGVKTAAVLVVLVPFLITKTLLLIVYSGYNIPLLQAFLLQDVVIIVLQLIVSFVIFRVLDRTDEWITVFWILAGVLGVIVLYIGIPYLVSVLLPV